MMIKRIVDQHRRDLTAIFACQHCHYEESCRGYDDSYFHRIVIPQMKCPKCQKTAGDDYQPLAPKHPANAVL